MNKPLPRIRLQIIFACALAVASLAQATTTKTPLDQRLADATPRPALGQTAARLPLSFQPNLGQFNSEVRFLSRGTGYALFLTPNEAVLRLAEHTAGSAPTASPSNAEDEDAQVVQGLVRLQLVDANPSPRIVGLDEQTGKINYYLGKDPKQWRENISTYERVHYASVYPGIDLLFYGGDGQLEYDFIVAPGADPELIRLRVSDAGQLDIDASGNLVIKLGSSEVISHRPVVYQEREGERHPIAGQYVLQDNKQLAFEIGPYDRTLPLVIDPVLSYSTFWGGALAGEEGNAIAVDDNGNILIAGTTFSTDFPVTSAAQASCGTSPTLVTTGCQDAFVTKLNPAGDTVIYSTFLGGGETTFVSNSGRDIAHGIATDSAGNAYVTGETNSLSFPATAGAFQTSCRAHPFQEGSDPGGNCLEDAFVAKLSPSGALVYATYMGGANTDIGYAIGVNGGGNAYVTGLTFSDDDPDTSTDESFPITATAWFPTCRGGQSDPPYQQSCHDAFYAKLSANGSFLVQSSYLGGSGNDVGNGITVDSIGNAWITGHTTSDDFLVVVAKDPFRDACGGPSATTSPCDDGFVTKVGASASAGCIPVSGDNCLGSPLNGYSTYLGGVGIGGQDVAVDSTGNAYVVGDGGTIVTTPGAYDTSHNLGADAFISKLNAAGTDLVYSTYLGGRGHDRGMGIDLDASNGAYVTGSTLGRYDFFTGKLENDFPTVGEFQSDCGRDAGGNCRSEDAFVSQLSPDGSSLVFSSYLGGSHVDNGRGIAVGGAAHVTGQTSSADFPTADPLQANLLGFGDAFIAKIARNTPVGSNVQVDPAPGVSMTFTEVTVAGDTTVTTSTEDPGPPGSTLQFLGTYYDITTTATYTGPVEVCLAYDDTGLTFGQELALRLYHLENGNWIDRTSSLDTTNNVICASVSSLSWFGVAEIEDSDSDGLTDDIDNCILAPNGPTLPDAGGNVQLDTDGDGYGNLCDPDFDNNLVVNAADLAYMKTNFFSADPDADLDGSGIVNAADLAILKIMFFGPPGPSGLVP